MVDGFQVRRDGLVAINGNTDLKLTPCELVARSFPPGPGAHVLAGKGYDADRIRELMEDQDCTPQYFAQAASLRRDHLQQEAIQTAQSHRAVL